MSWTENRSCPSLYPFIGHQVLWQYVFLWSSDCHGLLKSFVSCHELRLLFVAVLRCVLYFDKDITSFSNKFVIFFKENFGSIEKEIVPRTKTSPRSCPSLCVLFSGARCPHLVPTLSLTPTSIHPHFGTFVHVCTMYNYPPHFVYFCTTTSVLTSRSIHPHFWARVPYSRTPPDTKVPACAPCCLGPDCRLCSVSGLWFSGLWVSGLWLGGAASFTDRQSTTLTLVVGAGWQVRRVSFFGIFSTESE